MIKTPFSLLLPYADRLTVAWWSKKDDVSFDQAGLMVGAHSVVWGEQVHGGDVAAVSAAPNDHIVTGVDALVTATADLLMLSKTADCQTFVCYSPARHVAAVIHAGWRGLLANVIPHTMTLLMEEFTIDPSELFVGAAPSLCLAHSGFSNPHEELPTIDPKFFHDTHVDLRGIADEQLEQCGVKSEHRERMQLCPACDPELLWSYRGGHRESVKQAKRNLVGCVLH